MRDQFIRKSIEKKKVNWISNEQQNNQQKSLKHQIRALTNEPHDFTIKLPERLQFDKKWSITLKKIFIGNDLYNIYREI